MRIKLFIGGIILILISLVLIISLIGILLGIPLLLIGALMVFISIFVLGNRGVIPPDSI
jgi:hypothetical protein